MLKDEKYNNTSIENIKPEAWVSHFESLGKLDDNFKDRAFQLHHQVQELESQPIFNHLDNVIKVEKIYEAISKLKNKKAVGLDSISNEMLRQHKPRWDHVCSNCLMHVYQVDSIPHNGLVGT